MLSGLRDCHQQHFSAALSPGLAKRLGFRVSGSLAVIAGAARLRSLDFDQAVIMLTQEPTSAYHQR